VVGGDDGLGVTLTLGLEICSGAGREGPAPGPLQSSEADPVLGSPQALADGDWFFHGIDV
jgi:hypothetical protein